VTTGTDGGYGLPLLRISRRLSEGRGKCEGDGCGYKPFVHDQSCSEIFAGYLVSDLLTYGQRP
jgi:hypothetical protein